MKKTRCKPMIAILEAMHKAEAWGCRILEARSNRKLPVHFAIYDHGCTSIVRVRRLKYAGYRCEDIERSCATDIKEIRKMDLAEEIFRELWVRGPDRTWNRYVVFPDCIECLDFGIEQQSRAIMR
ncbi:MAG: hypothetical protein GYA23_13230 [Methanomicrobiales archaeon]|nr:hypothetical protein [Methanomicrobiales archaeon]